MSEQSQAGNYRNVLSHPLAAVLFVAGVLYIASAVILPINQLTQSTSTATMNISGPASQVLLSRVPGVPANAHVESTAPNGITVSVVAEPQVGQDAVPVELRLLSEAGTSLWALAVGVILILLALIVGTIARGNPFDKRNARRMVGIAVSLLVASLGADTLNFINANAVASYLHVHEPLVVVAYYSWLPLLVAVVSIVFAFAFRRGQQIQDDVEGLV